MEVSDNRRPIYAVLTEPIRANMKSTNESENIDIKSDKNDYISYIPKAHVQFLEQSGIRVVPVSF